MRHRLIVLLLAPLVWAAHFLACYVLVSLACAYGFGGVRTGIGVLTLLALALIGWHAMSNYREWMDARRVGPVYRPDADIRIFFSLNAMLLCAVSAVALVWVAVPAAMLPACAA